MNIFKEIKEHFKIARELKKNMDRLKVIHYDIWCFEECIRTGNYPYGMDKESSLKQIKKLQEEESFLKFQLGIACTVCPIGKAKEGSDIVSNTEASPEARAKAKLSQIVNLQDEVFQLLKEIDPNKDESLERVLDPNMGDCIVDGKICNFHPNGININKPLTVEMADDNKAVVEIKFEDTATAGSHI